MWKNVHLSYIWTKFRVRMGTKIHGKSVKKNILEEVLRGFRKESGR